MRLKFPAKTEKAMGIDTNPFPEIGEAAANVGMPNFQNLSLKELEEVTVQMHVASQAAFRKNPKSSPADGQSSAGLKEGSSEEMLDDDSLEVARV